MNTYSKGQPTICSRCERGSLVKDPSWGIDCWKCYNCGHTVRYDDCGARVETVYGDYFDDDGFYKDVEVPVGVRADGGPSDYYDFPEQWSTFNDFIEFKSEHQWKEHSFHLGNIGKVLCRWGDKEGTSILYDTKKIIYSACRIFAKVAGKESLREYLKRLLDDPQFKE